jgi:hypothetical protein
MSTSAEKRARSSDMDSHETGLLKGKKPRGNSENYRYYCDRYLLHIVRLVVSSNDGNSSRGRRAIEQRMLMATSSGTLESRPLRECDKKQLWTREKLQLLRQWRDQRQRSSSLAELLLLLPPPRQVQTSFSVIVELTLHHPLFGGSSSTLN